MLVEKNFEFCTKQYSLMLEKIGQMGKFPRTIGKDGNLVLVHPADWTTGFFPGCLWYIYEFSKDKKWKAAASHFTENLEEEKFNNTNHDIGFKMLCSFGNGYRLTGNKKYIDILIQSAKTLISRFHPVIGCIKSWDHHKEVGEFPVIIDNLMNLELLFWASKQSGDPTFYNVAVSHANKTMQNHFRKDFSTYHVLNYDTKTGEVKAKVTVQGYADESCWARGQAWALYGYTMCYRETKDIRYLELAQKIADYILKHKNLHEDMIPYWDYDAPQIPNEERDASAAAIMASAFYELSTFVNVSKYDYKKVAEKILENLSSQNFLSKFGDNNNFLLKHSTGYKPIGKEVDVPLIYADYYFLEANLRKIKLEGNKM